MDQPHYRFPPASAYRLNRCLFALKSDDEFRTRFGQRVPDQLLPQGQPFGIGPPKQLRQRCPLFGC